MMLTDVIKKVASTIINGEVRHSEVIIEKESYIDMMYVVDKFMVRQTELHYFIYKHLELFSYFGIGLDRSLSIVTYNGKVVKYLDAAGILCLV